MNRTIFEHMFLYLLFALPFFVTAVALYGELPTTPKPDPEKANFMMECVYGWEQTAENCEAIWQGEPPPPLPEYDEGC